MSILDYFPRLRDKMLIVMFADKVNDATRLESNPAYYNRLRSRTGYRYALISEEQLRMPFVEMQREEDDGCDDRPMWTTRKFAPKDVLTFITRDESEIEVVTRLFPHMIGPAPVFSN